MKFSQLTKLSLALFIGLSVMFVPPVTVKAQTTADGVKVVQENGATYLSTEVDTTVAAATHAGALRIKPIKLPTGFATNFGNWINGVLSIVMMIAALLVLFYLISAAFDWITSGGDKGQTEKARNKITAAIIGLVIVASAYAVLTLALNFLGFEDLNDVFRRSGTIQGEIPVRDPKTVGSEASPSPSASLPLLSIPSPSPSASTSTGIPTLFN